MAPGFDWTNGDTPQPAQTWQPFQGFDIPYPLPPPGRPRNIGRHAPLLDDKDFLDFEPRLDSGNHTREQITELAEARMESDRLSIFKFYLSQFETRARRDGLSQNEIDETYKQIGRVLNSHEMVPLTLGQKIIVAEQILRNAAVPPSISQGDHNSCGGAVMEFICYLKKPSLAARMVADVALNGRLDTGSMSFDLDPQPHDSSRIRDPRYGQRNHASEIFQSAVINIALRKRDDDAARNGLITYRQTERRLGSLNSGEVLEDRSTFPPRITPFKGLYVSDVVNIHEHLFGGDSDYAVLWFSEKGKARDGAGETYGSEQEFEAKLAQLKRNNRLPVVILVHSGNDPLWTESPVNQNGARGSWHYITITDYQEGRNGAPPVVLADSTWWAHADHDSRDPLSLKEAFQAALPPAEAENAIRAEVEENRRAGKIDHAREIVLLRQEWMNGKLTDHQFEDSLAELVLFANHRWSESEKTGSLDRAERERSIDKLMHAVDRLPYEQKFRMLRLLNRQSLLSDVDYDRAIAATGIEMSDNRFNAMLSGELAMIGDHVFTNGNDQLNKLLAELPGWRREQVMQMLKAKRIADESGFFPRQAKERRERRQV